VTTPPGRHRRTAPAGSGEQGTADAGAGPLSFGQERLWRNHAIAPDSAAYNLALALRFRDGVAPQPLREALAGLVDRHEILRMRYHGDQPEAVRHVPVDAFAVTLAWQDIEGDDWRPVAAQALSHPFDLAAAPPVRGVVARCADGSAMVVLVMHHLLADGRSLPLLARDLAALYESASIGQPSGLAPLDVGYLEFARVQRRQWAASSPRPHLDFWRSYLSGAQPLTLPLDRPRPRLSGSAGGVVPVTAPPRVGTAIRDFAMRQRGTVASVVLAAFHATLGLYARQYDFAIGSVLHGRKGARWRDVVGYFVNTVPVRVAREPGMSFRELYRRTETSLRSVHRHQETPLDEVVAEVAPYTEAGRHPLFDVMCAHQGERSSRPTPSERITRLPMPPASIRFDLELSTSLWDDQLRGLLRYRADLFEHGVADSLAGSFERLLEDALADPDAPVESLALTSAAERDKILVGWNRTATAPARPGTLPDLFAAQVAATPRATAVIGEDGTWDYAELAARVHRLARYLICLGLGPEDVVAVMLPRSMPRIAAVLAVMHAGATYLPVDPDYPRSRIDFLLRDCHAAAVLTDSATTESVPSPRAAARILLDCLDTTGLSSDPIRDTDRLGPLLPDHPAYLIYTSGSTGDPKGVVVSHAGVGNLRTALVDNLHTGPGSRVLQYFSPSFDGAIWDTFIPLLTGAAVVVVATEQLAPGQALRETAARFAVTHLTLPPTALTLMSPDTLPGVQHLVVAGEACPRQVVTSWAPGRRLVNAYGPTEASVCVTMSGPLSGRDRTPTIGTPLPGVRVFVLDSRLEPVPIGMIGELYLAGPGLARGYRNAPALTVQRFVACPYGEPGQRMYRTGDLVRWRPDGRLTFVDRADNQVKLRGFRVELGEIEAGLARHPAVTWAAAAVLRDGPDTQRLVGYVGGDPQAPPDPADVRHRCAQWLPAHMVPETVMLLPQPPLSPNGKLDRAALPRPPLRSEPPRGAAAGGDSVQAIVQRLCAEVLERDSVGLDDDFFALGGDSVSAMRLVNRVRATLGCELPLRQIFAAQTVGDIIASVRSQLAAAPPIAGDTPPQPPVQPAGGSP
jgi:pristinamycin I synthase-3/4